MKTRLAPTPSGFLHFGNVLSFALTWVLARRAGWQILLRIDDGDAARKRPEYVEDIFQTLTAIGIDWDEGPSGPTDFESRWSQRHRRPLYQSVLSRLSANPEAIYACTCSRKEVAAHSVKGLYGNTCRPANHPLDDPKINCNWRLKTSEEDQVQMTNFDGEVNTLYPGQTMGDFVLRKKDGWPAYQLSSVIDDLHFGVSHIVRGEDLLDSTGAQLLLTQKLSVVYPEFASFSTIRFLHHPLILDEKGQKLSKSAGAAAEGGWIRESGAKKALLQQLANLLGAGAIPEGLEGFLMMDY